MCELGKTKFIVKTLGGDFISLRNSQNFAYNDAIKHFDETGDKCVILEVEVKGIHTQD